MVLIMKKITHILFILIALFCITSCYVDKGNYDYTPISDIVIEGIETSYLKVSAVDTLIISPQLNTTYSENELEYVWVMFDSKNNRDTLSLGKNLTYKVKESPGSYQVFFFVKNKTNGYYVHSITSLNVVTEYSRGHYILKEDASGNTDFDLLLDDGRLISNILLTAQGSTLSGKPRSMGLLYSKQFVDPDLLTKTSAHCLGVITYNKKANIYRAFDMKPLFEHSSMFYEEPDDVPYKFLTVMWMNTYLSDKGAFSTYVSEQGTGKLGFPTGVPGGSDYWAVSPSLAGMVYWDETNSRILWNNYNGIASVLTDAVYPTSGLNYDCLFMGNYRGVVYSLFKDKSNSSRLVLYRITTSSMSRPPKVNNVIEIDINSKMHGATLFASNQYTADIIYFVNSNKLYYYDVTNNAEHEITAAGLPANETITFIANRQYTVASPTFDYLTIGTYLNGTYKLYMYNMIGGQPNGDPVRTTSGTGRIKETHYLGTSFSDFDLLFGLRYSR
jgi:hypothetical protein